MVQKAHIVAIQEPPLFNGKPLQAPSFTLYSPSPDLQYDKISSCLYIANSLLEKHSAAAIPSSRGDTISVNLFIKNSRSSFSSMHIINVYNRQISSYSRSTDPELMFIHSHDPTIILGDFNIHNPQADPYRSFSPRELSLSQPYFAAAASKAYTLLNNPGVYTRISPRQDQRHSVIDLAFANSRAASLVRKWLPLSADTGSDHRVLALTISSPSSDLNPLISPNWKLTDWEKLTPALKAFQVLPPTSLDIDSWFEDNLDGLNRLIRRHSPPKVTCKWSKPWWNPNIQQLRTIFHSVQRAYRKGLAPPFEAKAAKNAYFNAIKRAKQAHWNQYVANAATKDVWKLKKSTTRTEDRIPTLPNSPTPLALNNNLIEAFFPPRQDPPPPNPLLFREVPPITPEEVHKVLSTTSNLSAPGPDTIPYPVWKGVHRANPMILPSLLNPLIKHGYHPLTLKRANGVILAKPAKPNYSLPSAYRIIVLLQTVSKILEKIMTLRLALIARNTGLIHPHQCGSVAGLSTADAATTLIHETRAMQHAGLKVSTLLLDIKGGFDHVLKQPLALALSSGHTPPYMINWILSFLSDRYITLLFKGSPKIPSPIQVGVPQGSPISPLLFLIYVNILHLQDPSPGITLSYVGDFAITVGSHSYEDNVLILTNHYAHLVQAATPRNITFSVAKTEFIHWRTPRDRQPPSQYPITLEGHTFHPAPKVKWIGLWLSQSLDPNVHFTHRLASAQATFGLIQRFSSAGKGLTSANCLRLAHQAIRPMLTYGATVFLPTHALRAIKKFWNSVLRWATGCFRATNLCALYIEAASPPLDIYMEFLRIKYATRILQASPLNNPVTARSPKNFPTLSTNRLYSHSALLKGRPNPPKKWDSTAKKGVSPLPIDALCALIRPMLEENIPPDRLILFAKKRLLALWEITHPPPVYYPFLPSLTLPIFTTLHKFSASRIHQIRTNKSYLRAHKSWININASEVCPHCNAEPETTHHAIFACSAKEDARSRLLPNITSLEEIWDSLPLTLALGAYITSTRTNFPIKDLPSPLLSGSASSTLSSLSSLSL